MTLYTIYFIHVIKMSIKIRLSTYYLYRYTGILVGIILFKFFFKNINVQSVQNIVSIITKIYEMECWNNRDSTTAERKSLSGDTPISEIIF